MSETSPSKTPRSRPHLDESLLAPLAPFEKLERGDIRRILDQAVSTRIEAEQAIFDEGAPAERFYLLLDGTIRVVHLTPEGEQVTVLHIPAGELFGFAAAIGRDSYPGTAIAAAECIVLSWPMHLWTGFSQRHPGFASATRRTIGQRMGEMNSRVVELATLHVEQRIARALMRLVDQFGIRTETGIEIDFPVTRQDIADMTGTTLYTVSRLLSRWTRDGIIAAERQHKRITVRAPHRLVELGEAALPG